MNIAGWGLPLMWGGAATFAAMVISAMVIAGKNNYKEEADFLIAHECHIMYIDAYSERTQYHCKNFDWTGRLHKEIP